MQTQLTETSHLPLSRHLWKFFRKAHSNRVPYDPTQEKRTPIFSGRVTNRYFYCRVYQHPVMNTPSCNVFCLNDVCKILNFCYVQIQRELVNVLKIYQHSS